MRSDHVERSNSTVNEAQDAASAKYRKRRFDFLGYTFGRLLLAADGQVPAMGMKPIKEGEHPAHLYASLHARPQRDGGCP